MVAADFPERRFFRTAFWSAAWLALALFSFVVLNFDNHGREITGTDVVLWFFLVLLFPLYVLKVNALHPRGTRWRMWFGVAWLLPAFAYSYYILALRPTVAIEPLTGVWCVVMPILAAGAMARFGNKPSPVAPRPSGAHGTARVGDRTDVEQHTDLEAAEW